MSTPIEGRRAIVIVLGVIALTVVAVLAIAVRRGPIEDDLTRRSEASLAAAGISGVTVEFDGRDGTLSGQVSSEADRLAALSIVGELEGVRVIEALVTVASAAPAPTSAEAPVALDGVVGTDPAEVTAIGYGTTRPVAADSAQEGQPVNGRIEFTVEGAG